MLEGRVTGAVSALGLKLLTWAQRLLRAQVRALGRGRGSRKQTRGLGQCQEWFHPSPLFLQHSEEEGFGAQASAPRVQPQAAEECQQPVSSPAPSPPCSLLTNSQQPPRRG